MKYEPIPQSLFLKNRQKLADRMTANHIAIFNSNDIMPTNADGAMPFHQNADIFYLSGIDQEESILVMYPDARKEEWKNMLFLRETNEKIAIWEGHKYTKAEATETSGITSVHWFAEFETILKTIIFEADGVYLNTNEHLRNSSLVQTRDDRFREWMKEKFPLVQYRSIAPQMHRLRSVKEPEEVALIQHACDITEKTFRRVLNFVKPGVIEYEIEAEILHEFIRRRSKGEAYGSIIASGHSACVLHYVENNRACKDGDVILMDFGAEYANYASDLTRSIPVNGHFSKRQKEVYNAVLNVQKAAIPLLRPGVMLDDYHKQVGKLMEKELLDLGLISMNDIKNEDPAWPAYKKYYMHGTSHFMGIDVHDVGLWSEPIKAGYVFTCEPGIYIPEENLGIRIENDILVTEDGHIDFMKNTPREADEIEALMNA